MTVTTDLPPLAMVGPDGGPIRWSHSAGDKAARCPLEWAHRNGPLRERFREQVGERVTSIDQRRGLVVHDAIAAGLQAAATDPGAHPGGPLDVYWPIVRRALGEAWNRHKMPPSHAEAERVTAMAYYACGVLTVPHPRDVIAIEADRDALTPGGRPFRYVIDYGRWVGPRVRITDWKTGWQDPETAAKSVQLARYAWFLARDLDIDLGVVDVELYNLNRQATRVVPVDAAFAERAVHKIDSLAEEMERSAARGWFEGRPSPSCAGCDVRKVCPALAARQVPEAGQ